MEAGGGDSLGTYFFTRQRSSLGQDGIMFMMVVRCKHQRFFSLIGTYYRSGTVATFRRLLGFLVHLLISVTRGRFRFLQGKDSLQGEQGDGTLCLIASLGRDHNDFATRGTYATSRGSFRDGSPIWLCVFTGLGAGSILRCKIGRQGL